MNTPEPNKITFKTLRTLDPETLGSKPLEIDSQRPHFPNATGGLRTVKQGDTRILAAASAKRLIEAHANA